MRASSARFVLAAAFLLASPLAGSVAVGQKPSLPPVRGAEVKCEGGKAKNFDCGDVDLLSFLPMDSIGGSESSGIWGWIDSTTKREFAIVGRANGTAFIEVTDPVNPQYLGDLPVPRGCAAGRLARHEGV